MIAALVLAAAVYSGRDNQVHVQPPRVDAPAAIVTIDGVMDEAVWQQAVRLTDFSQYSPVDGRPADDPTEVFVFYSPTTLYFGIKARAAAGSVHATLANRDSLPGPAPASRCGALPHSQGNRPRCVRGR